MMQYWNTETYIELIWSMARESYGWSKREARKKREGAK